MCPKHRECTCCLPRISMWGPLVTLVPINVGLLHLVPHPSNGHGALLQHTPVCPVCHTLCVGISRSVHMCLPPLQVQTNPLLLASPQGCMISGCCDCRLPMQIMHVSLHCSRARGPSCLDYPVHPFLRLRARTICIQHNSSFAVHISVNRKGAVMLPTPPLITMPHDLSARGATNSIFSEDKLSFYFTQFSSILLDDTQFLILIKI